MPLHNLHDYFLGQKKVFFKKGSIVPLKTHSEPDSYYLENGIIKMYGLTKNGNEKIFAFFKEPTVFPVISFFYQIQSEVFYEAVTDITVYQVKNKDFMDFLGKNPKMLFELINLLIEVLSLYIERIDNLELGKAQLRLICKLLYLARRFGDGKDKNVIILLPLTHKDLANTVALTRETTSRELEHLEKMGLIKYSKHMFTIPNMKNLERELENNS